MADTTTIRGWHLRFDFATRHAATRGHTTKACSGHRWEKLVQQRFGCFALDYPFMYNSWLYVLSTWAAATIVTAVDQMERQDKLGRGWDGSRFGASFLCDPGETDFEYSAKETLLFDQLRRKGSTWYHIGWDADSGTTSDSLGRSVGPKPPHSSGYGFGLFGLLFACFMLSRDL